MKFLNHLVIALALVIGITVPSAAMHKRSHEVMNEKSAKSVLHCDEALEDSDKESEISEAAHSLAHLTAQVEKANMKDNDEIDPLRNPTRITQIIKAICQNNAHTVVRIVQHWDQEGTLETNINQQNSWGETALHIAVSTVHEHFLSHTNDVIRRDYLQKKRQIIHALMHAGADHTIRSKLNRTAIRQATEYLKEADAKVMHFCIAEALREEKNADTEENCKCIAWGV